MENEVCAKKVKAAGRFALFSHAASRERPAKFIVARAGMGSFDSAEPFASRMARLRSG
jgi:hypothetical protein